MTAGEVAPAISVVVPFFEEEESVPRFFEELLGVLDRSGLDAEVVAVDDGSGDATWDRLAAVRDRDPRVRAIRFRRNFGQTAALAAGFEAARGGVIVTMDGDLQNDPADIPALLATLDEGWDVVSGWRHQRKDDVLTRILPSRMANGMISWATQVQLHDYGCGIKAYRAEIAKSLNLYGEMHRFLPAIAGDLGFDADDAVPVSLLAGKTFNVEKVWENIASALPEAMRAQLLRCLHELKEDWSWSSVWSQTANAGRVIAGSIRNRK